MIRILSDLESLSQAAVELIVSQSMKAIESRGRFSLVLSGGSTPRRTYQLLADGRFKDKIEWKKVHVFWGDERCVPPDDERSNERMAREAFLNRVPIPPQQVHPIRCAGNPQQSADVYESILKSYFGEDPPVFDLVHLGLGEDGHTASLFPGSPVLNENKKWVSVSKLGRENFNRVTLTAPLINQARLIMFLVSGRKKAGVFREVTANKSGKEPLPAGLIDPANGELVWMVDKEAGGLR